MAQKVGLLNYWLLGAWADRTAINQNADDLAYVEASVDSLQATVKRQGQEIDRALLVASVDELLG
jgi:hypothetical protein